MEEIRQEEQQKLNHVVAVMEELIESLNQPTSPPQNAVDAYLQGSRMKKLRQYTQAIESPYFGRLDLEENGVIETVYFGKTGIAKDEENPLVLDWRTPLYSVFTRFTGNRRDLSYDAPGGKSLVYVAGKRHIEIESRTVISVSEIGSSSRKDSDRPHNDTDRQENYLLKVLSRKNEAHQVKEIIATLQQEQDEIIRLDMSSPVIVQGVAGSGKSSIALHRISYLLFRYKDMLKPENILILAPNQMFLSYMRNVAPELDITDIQQDTFIEWAKKTLKISAKVIEPYKKLAQVINGDLSLEEFEAVSKFKGSIRFKQSIDRYMDEIKDQLFKGNDLILNQEVALSQEKIRVMVEGKKHLPVNKLRKEVVQSIIQWAKEEEKRYIETIHHQFESACHHWVYPLPEGDVRRATYESLERARDLRIESIHAEFTQKVKEYISQWKPFDSSSLYKTIFNPQLLKLLVPDLEPNLLEQLVQSASRLDKQIDYEDLAALLYIEFLLNGPPQQVDYLVVDEAQDLSPFQFEILGQISKSITILGDITQSIFSFAGLSDWDTVAAKVFQDNPPRVLEIKTSYRSTRRIMELANRIINNSSLRLPNIVPVNRSGEPPLLQQVTDANDLSAKILGSLNTFVQKGYKKIAIIPKEIRQAQSLYEHLTKKSDLTSIQLITDSSQELNQEITIIPSYLVKGLEFDAVILPNANRDRFSTDDLDAKLLFVCVTRANHELHIFYHREMSPLLREDGPVEVTAGSEWDGIL